MVVYPLAELEELQRIALGRLVCDGESPAYEVNWSVIVSPYKLPYGPSHTFQISQKLGVALLLSDIVQDRQEPSAGDAYSVHSGSQKEQTKRKKRPHD